MAANESPAKSVSEPYRVLIADDSAVIRGVLARVLDSDPDITVVDRVANGELAIAATRRHAPDVVVLDIEMPVMDGLTALPKILEVDPKVKVVMASTLTLRNADISLKALALGAADYIPKPTSATDITAGYDFKRELVAKVKALAAVRRAAGAGPAAARSATEKGTSGRIVTVASSAPRVYRGVTFKLRELGRMPPAVIAIGSSTGGPQALFHLMPQLKDLHQPILVTQHMPATFTTILAEHLQKLVGRPCAEAVDGEAVKGGQIYIAPGNFHLTVEAVKGQQLIRLSQSPPENFCRPAVDPMLRSLAQVYGRNILVVMLTGMGQDGLIGSKAVVEAGGTVVAQDEATSVVWGMPGAVATAGLCSAVLPIGEIGAFTCKLAMRRAA
ncbi:MAG: chemotaxis response regulator protein-glutamate methylesterase [Alphaproteobacteria bacterium]